MSKSCSKTVIELSLAQMLCEIAAAFQVPTNLLCGSRRGGYWVAADFAFEVALYVRRGVISEGPGWFGLRRPDEV